ncbi:Secreted RxLR effector peptide protein [Phytophthora palmivora]|uniref:RxLR effector protein n=1 Tax=Phytophthora palmivora TaxID=4796 RepID=A0A2P4XRT5_9STRA|nr:Secreted RxLR effector peptide protein [Phytophthora palmivora]
MRLSFILLTVVGSGVALTGAMPLGFLHLVGADQSVSDQTRFLRGNNIAEGDKEERMFAKDLVDKMVRTNSLSALEKVDDPAMIKKLLAASEDKLASVFKFLDDANMKPADLAIHMKGIEGADDDIMKKAIEMYTKYLAK